MKSEMNLDLTSPEQVTLEDKVAQFKNDPEKMKEANEFVDELLEKAKIDAEAKAKEQDRAKAEAEAEQGMKRRIGTRARGFIVRLFEAICNCTHTGPAAARPATPSKK
ncbi:uncharacterized protein LOC143920163 [Arctopsyche grandis]|uniref:uncharacterized protein LOC143920163 n=1 Tax=Arctopsyche grandis TaxID=121162 RepID=UPI00406D6910